MSENNSDQMKPTSLGCILSADTICDNQQEYLNESDSTEAHRSSASKSTKATGDTTNKKHKPPRNKKINDTYVKHDYHDYSKVKYEDIPSNCTSSYHMNHKGGNDSLFPQKLHDVLSQAENSDPDVISWAPVSYFNMFIV